MHLSQDFSFDYQRLIWLWQEVPTCGSNRMDYHILLQHTI
jgi:hypothetical protein